MNSCLATVNPAMMIAAILAENPGFDLNDPPREIVNLVVVAWENLRATLRPRSHRRTRKCGV